MTKDELRKSIESEMQQETSIKQILTQFKMAKWDSAYLTNYDPSLVEHLFQHALVRRQASIDQKLLELEELENEK